MFSGKRRRPSSNRFQVADAYQRPIPHGGSPPDWVDLTDLRQTIPGSPARSNRRPIELGLPAIPDLRPLSCRVINATSTSLFHAPHSIFAKRLVCCADQLNPPRKAAVRRMGGYGMAAPGAKRTVGGPFEPRREHRRERRQVVTPPTPKHSSPRTIRGLDASRGYLRSNQCQRLQP
jgi:hypothetical protein